jgi:5-methylcytosine-specific restriction endonuclease McrA
MVKKVGDIIARQIQNNIEEEDFYLSDAWRRARYQVLMKYGSICQCCGAKPPFVSIHVDHIKPKSKFPDLALDLDNLQVLCEACNFGKSNVYITDHRPHDRQFGDGDKYDILIERQEGGELLSDVDKDFIRRYLLQAGRWR